MTPKKDAPAGKAARAEILERLRSPNYEPAPQKELLHRMSLPKARRELYRNAIGDLLERGEAVKLSRGRIAAAESRETEGWLKRTAEGHGWVSPGGGAEAVFVHAEQLQGTLSGDRVRVRKGRAGRGGKLMKVVEERRRDITGVVQQRGRDLVLQPFDSGIGLLNLPAAKRKGAQPDDAVLARVEATPEGDRQGAAAVLKIFGPFGDAGVDIAVVRHRFGLACDFPKAALAEAERLPTRIGPKQKESRERFDDPAPVTIDGITAQDFDDAIAVQRMPHGRFRLWVHIADVAYFVPPGSELDKEAVRRGTSVYFPGTVVPMFPEKISNDLCSLRPGVDRLVHSIVLDLEADGEIRKIRFADGVIHSAGRLTYSDVAEFLEGKQVKGIAAPVGEMLHAANELRQALESRRARRGSIDFDLPRPTILLDVEGEMTGIQIEPRNRAHRLIEECMLVANEAVAGHLAEAGHPCMYRIHEEPDPAKLEKLVEFAQAMGLQWPSVRGGDESDPSWISKLLSHFDGKPEQPVVQQLALRTMKQARYSMQNAGHFGLAAPTYCHFTSPIRRYPDLAVHRLLRGKRYRKRRDEDRTDYESLAESCSQLERNAESAERELLLWKKTAYIADQVGSIFEGVITGVAPFGLFVQLSESHVEGLMRVENLGGSDRWDLDEVRQRWVARNSGKRIGLGDPVKVRVDRVDKVLRRVDFSLEGSAREKRPRSGSRPAGRAGTRPGAPRPRVRPAAAGRRKPRSNRKAKRR